MFIHSFRWEFFSEDGDIGFHIYYVDGDEKVDVIPWSRVDCHVVQEEGRVACSRLTTCEFMQINSKQSDACRSHLHNTARYEWISMFFRPFDSYRRVLQKVFWVRVDRTNRSAGNSRKVGAWVGAIFERGDYSAERFIWSSWTQKIFDRTHQWLSNGVKQQTWKSKGKLRCDILLTGSQLCPWDYAN